MNMVIVLERGKQIIDSSFRFRKSFGRWTNVRADMHNSETCPPFNLDNYTLITFHLPGPQDLGGATFTYWLKFNRVYLSTFP